MDTILQDLRYAIRMLLKSPRFTLVALLTLGLGIGANTSIFSVLNAMVLRPLPYSEPERLVLVRETHEGKPASNGLAAFLDWREQNTVFEDIALTEFDALNLTGQSFPGFGEPEKIVGASVTAAFFPLLGVRPLLGRVFLPGEDYPGRDSVIVLSHQLWQRRFGARSDILNQSLTFQGKTYTVVGVMPPGFRWSSGAPSEYWVPLAYNPKGSYGRMQHQFGAIARLKRDVSLEAAQAQLSAIARRIEQQFPHTNKGWGVLVAPLSEEFVAEARPALFVLSAAVGFVLLIACANVANLLLARAAERTREIAIRTALGAGRARVIRLVLTESILLSLTSGALGMIFALWGVEALSSTLPAHVELLRAIEIDGWVLAFTLAVSLSTGLLFGLAPALRSSKTSVQEALKSSGPATGISLSRSRFLKAVMVSEVSLAVVLLIAAGLLTKSFAGLFAVNLGFRTERLLTMELELPWTEFRQPEQRIAFYRDLLDRIRALPGVVSVGGIDMMPLSGYYSGGGFTIEGRPAPETWRQMSAQHCIATPEYFRTMGIPLRQGRLFGEQERSGSEAVAIINDTMARRFWPGMDPIGHRIRFMGGNPMTIVGIVGDIRHNGPAREAGPQLYIPYEQWPSALLFLAVRTVSDPLRLASAVRAEIRQMDPGLPVARLRTMEQALSDWVAGPRIITMLLGSFAAFALVLACMGLYGVTAYSISQRTHEVGVRMALGAGRLDVLRLVLGDAMLLVLPGLAIGLAGAFAVTRVLSSLLYRVTATDPTIFTAVPVLLAAVAVLAGYLPARRAARIDPVEALRYE